MLKRLKAITSAFTTINKKQLKKFLSRIFRRNMAKQKKAEYKPLLFSTTVRNPERIKGAIKVLAKYDGQILTNELAISIFKDLIKEKKYEVASAWSNPATEHLRSIYYSEEVLILVIINTNRQLNCSVCLIKKSFFLNYFFIVLFFILLQ